MKIFVLHKATRDRYDAFSLDSDILFAHTDEQVVRTHARIIGVYAPSLTLIEVDDKGGTLVTNMGYVFS